MITKVKKLLTIESSVITHLFYKEGAVLGLMGDLALERSRTVTGPAVRQERCSQDPYENIEIDGKKAVINTGPVSVMSIEEKVYDCDRRK